MSVASMTRKRLPDWPVWTLFVGIALLISLTAVGTGVVGVVAAVIGHASGSPSNSRSPGVTIASTVALDVSMVGSVLIAAKIADGRIRLQSLGFVPIAVSRRRAALLAAASWVAFVIVILCLQAIFGKAEKQTIVQQFGAHQSDVLWVITFLMLGVVAPLCEEFLFRGFVFSTLWRRMPLLPAAVITGALFGALHLGGTAPELTLALGAFGAFLCFLRAATGSIVPCIAAHAMNNSISYSFGEHVPAVAGIAMIAGAVGIALVIGHFIVDRAYTRNDGSETVVEADVEDRGGVGGDGPDDGGTRFG